MEESDWTGDCGQRFVSLPLAAPRKRKKQDQKREIPRPFAFRNEVFV
jgi:hypothetical protein